MHVVVLQITSSDILVEDTYTKINYFSFRKSQIYLRIKKEKLYNITTNFS